jgi:uncharacterized protein
MKLLLWALIGLVLVLWLTRSGKKSSLKEEAREDMQPDCRTSEPSGEAMIQCAQCAVYLPASEAFSSQSGRLFCCEEHSLQHTGR